MTAPVIGIFDSGAGGLLVMKAVMEQLPEASIVYFGDTARLPYGDKSPATITRYTQASAAFLTSQTIDLLIVACNTAAAYTAEALRTSLPLPVIDVIEPSVEVACRLSQSGKIAVLGTQATIRSTCYQRRIGALRPDAQVTALACPLFVPLIEERMAHHPATTMIVEEYLRPLRGLDIDTLILGCTHYPLLKRHIATYLGGDVHIVDSAACCAQEVSSRLGSPLGGIGAIASAPHPTYRFFVSDDTERFRHLAAAFLPKLPATTTIALAQLNEL